MDENKEKWYDEMLQYLAEDIRETKVLVKETSRLAGAAEKKAEAAWAQVDQLRELVIITRSEWQDLRDDLKRAWWKKLFNIQ